MKLLVFGLALLIAGASALPDQAQVTDRQGRNFVDNLRNIIETLRKLIIDNNFDPFVISRHEQSIEYLPYLNIQYFVENVEFTGAGGIIVHTLDYSNLFSRCRFDLELPELVFKIGASSVNGLVLSTNVNTQLSGSLKISAIRLAGEAYVTVNIITGINIDTLEANFSLGGIESAVELTIQGTSYSDDVNEIAGETIPAWIKDNERDINRVLGTVIKYVAQIFV